MSQKMLKHPPRISCEIPFYTSKEFGPLFLLERGKNSSKAIVISIPKSGTYLLCELLRNADYETVRLNVRKNTIRDFRWKDMNDIENLDQPFPLGAVAKMIAPGQLLAGHVEYDDYTKTVLQNFKKIFIFRNLRDCLVSKMRHEERWGIQIDDRDMLRKMNPGPTKLLEFMKTNTMKHFLNNTKKIIEWYNDHDAFKISYEDLLGNYGKEKRNQKISDLFHFLNKNLNLNDIDSILNSTFAKDTLTKSGKRTSISEYWNEQVELKFCELGFDKLNHQLGYK